MDLVAIALEAVLIVACLVFVGLLIRTLTDVVIMPAEELDEELRERIRSAEDL